jgi:hypothetical protein
MSIGRVPGATGIQPSIVDAKGDIIAATAADSVSRLAVGSNNQVLTADSATATGLKWATPASGSTFVGCSAFHSTTFTVNGYANTVVPLNSENFDTDAFHSTSTNNSRMTIPSGKAGKYIYSYQVKMNTFSNGAFLRCQVFKNGSSIMETRFGTDGDGGSAAMFANSILLDLAVGDYIELYLYHQTGVTTFSVPQAEGFVNIYSVGA